MNELFLAWQDPLSRAWFPIGRLRRINGTYEFAYTGGAQKAALAKPLEAFPDWETVYEADELFPFFANRVPSSARADYEQITRWLDLEPGEADPMVILASNGGERETDSLEVFPRPEPDADGRYHIRFFAHGLRYFPLASQERVEKLKPDDPLVLMHDFQNVHDPNALMLRTMDNHTVGFCPRYLASDILRLLRENPELPIVRVKRVNDPSSPLQWRLLCSLTADWPADWEPFSGDEFQPIPRIVDTSSTKTS